jgi:hypothetical protein
MKSRGVYETPGGTILLAAHRAIESITLDRGAAHLKDELMPRYAELIYNGFWFSPEREMLQALIDKSQEHVEGEVRSSSTRATSSSPAARARNRSIRPTLVTFEDDKRRLRPEGRRRLHPPQRAAPAHAARVNALFWNRAGADTNDAIKALEREISPELSRHWSAIAQNRKLFERIDAVWQGHDRKALGEPRLPCPRGSLEGLRQGRRQAGRGRAEAACADQRGAGDSRHHVRAKRARRRIDMGHDPD